MSPKKGEPMSKVVKFDPKKPKAANTAGTPKIWVCACGCSTFELLSTHMLHCPVCETVSASPDGGWYTLDTDKMWQGDTPDATPIRDISGNGSVEFARARLRKYAADDDVAAILVFKEDGAVHAWSAVETREQLEWLKQKLDVAYELTTRNIADKEEK